MANANLPTTVYLPTVSPLSGQQLSVQQGVYCLPFGRWGLRFVLFSIFNEFLSN